MLNDRTRREREENDNPWLAGEALREENERLRTLARSIHIFAHPAAKKIPSGQEEEGDGSGWTMPNWLVEEKEKRAEKRAKEKEAKEKDAKLSTARNHTLSCTGVLYNGRLRAKLAPSAMLPMPDNLAEMEEEEMPRAQGVKANDINAMLGRKQAKTKARANKLGRKKAKTNARANAVSAVSAVSLNKMLAKTRKR
jgi:hypothetical protein